jgi:predicted transcriptional regulator
MAAQDQYLRAILATIARQTFTPSMIYEIVAVGSDKAKQLQAYNLCDGSRSQAEVAKSATIDPGSLSRTIGRWIDAGIVIRVGEGREVKPLHVYPLPETTVKKASGKNAQQSPS